MKPPQEAFIPPGNWDEVVRRQLGTLFREVYSLLRKHLDFTENMDGVLLTTITPVTPDQEFSLAHGLQRTPSGFLLLSQSKAGVVYKGTTAWNGTTAYFKCNVASDSVTIWIT